MKDIKTQQNMAGDEYWPMMPMVTVKGDSGAPVIPEGATQPEGETVVQQWQRVAVLEVRPAMEVYWGFMVGEHAQFMNVPVQLQDGQFGVRVGDGEVRFFVIPKDLKTRVNLSLVDVVDINDPHYVDLPVY